MHGAKAADAPVATPRSRLDELDGLRALMALWLVLVHAGQLSGLAEFDHPLARLLLTGQTRVHVFMMLSGFVIGVLLLRDQQRWTRFVRDRAARLFPVFLVALALAVAIRPLQHQVYADALWISQEMRETVLDRIDLETESLRAHILAHALLLHGLVPEQWLPHSDIALLGPAWSLSVIWQFYVVAMLLPLVFFRSRLAVVAWLALPGLFPAVQLLASLAELSFGYATLAEHLPLFLIGMATAWLLPVLRGLPVPTLRAVLGAGWAVAAIAGLVEEDRVGGLLLWLPLILWTLTFWAALDREAVLARTGRAVLSFGLLKPVAVISYGLFLVHVPMLNLVAWSLGGTALEEAGPLAWCVVLTLLGGALSLLLAALLYRLVELPADRWLRGRRPQPGSAIPRQPEAMALRIPVTGRFGRLF